MNIPNNCLPKSCLIGIFIISFAIICLVFLTGCTKAQAESPEVKTVVTQETTDIQAVEHDYQLILYNGGSRGTTWYPVGRFKTLERCEAMSHDAEILEVVMENFAIRNPLLICVKR